MLILRVGDLHIKPNNIKESEALMQFILETAKTNIVNCVEFEGDIFDTHSIVRLEVIEFWDRWFKTFSEQSFSVIVLAGNHDMCGDYGSSYSALNPFLSLQNDRFKIVTSPYFYYPYGYLPYIHDDNKFVEEANKLAEQGATVLVSHPNYKGAVYDNGTPINNGVDPDLLDKRFLHLIGGHIHTELEIGRVWYIGTPRWLTKSCSNKKKGIWLCRHDETGLMTGKEFVSTESVCTPIYSLTWKEGEEKPAIPERAKVDIELVGSSEWVTAQKADLKGLVSISSKLTDVKKSAIRKSGKSLYEFLSSYYKTDKREKLITYMKGLKLLG